MKKGLFNWTKWFWPDWVLLGSSRKQISKAVKESKEAKEEEEEEESGGEEEEESEFALEFDVRRLCGSMPVCLPGRRLTHAIYPALSTLYLDQYASETSHLFMNVYVHIVPLRWMLHMMLLQNRVCTSHLTQNRGLISGRDAHYHGFSPMREYRYAHRVPRDPLKDRGYLVGTKTIRVREARLIVDDHGRTKEGGHADPLRSAPTGTDQPKEWLKRLSTKNTTSSSDVQQDLLLLEDDYVVITSDLEARTLSMPRRRAVVMVFRSLLHNASSKGVIEIIDLPYIVRDQAFFLPRTKTVLLLRDFEIAYLDSHLWHPRHDIT
jgi:hypothetical protein